MFLRLNQPSPDDPTKDAATIDMYQHIQDLKLDLTSTGQITSDQLVFVLATNQAEADTDVKLAETHGYFLMISSHGDDTDKSMDTKSFFGRDDQSENAFLSGMNTKLGNNALNRWNTPWYSCDWLNGRTNARQEIAPSQYSKGIRQDILDHLGVK